MKRRAQSLIVARQRTVTCGGLPASSHFHAAGALDFSNSVLCFGPDTSIRVGLRPSPIQTRCAEMSKARTSPVRPRGGKRDARSSDETGVKGGTRESRLPKEEGESGPMFQRPADAQPGVRSATADPGPEDVREARDGGLIASEDMNSLGSAAAFNRSKTRLQHVAARFESAMSGYSARIRGSYKPPVRKASDEVSDYKAELHAALGRNAALEAEAIELRRRLHAALSVLRG